MGVACGSSVVAKQTIIIKRLPANPPVDLFANIAVSTDGDDIGTRPDRERRGP